MEEFVIVSGLSGAGKSSVAAYLEDLGFYCVDNLPVALIPGFADLCLAGGDNGHYKRVALVTDIRGGQSFDGLFSALNALKKRNCDYKILFVEASDEAIVNRYQETRHTHPLMRQGLSLAEAAAAERVTLLPVRQRATHIIDTTALSQAKLRGELLRIFSRGEPIESMRISVTSFGFKYGIPIEADLVFDVRFLPNPFYISELKELTGLDEAVRNFLFDHQQTHDFIRHLESLLDFLLPQYMAEGKTALVIALGCTGGRHRSVALARTLSNFIRQKGYRAGENHRDMTRE